MILILFADTGLPVDRAFATQSFLTQGENRYDSHFFAREDGPGVFNWQVKARKGRASLISYGREFQSRGAMTEKAEKEMKKGVLWAALKMFGRSHLDPPTHT